MKVHGRRYREISALLLLCLVLAACGGRMTPAPVVHGTAGAKGPSGVVQAGGEVTVREGDSLYNIARRHGVGLRALIDANGIAPPYTIFPGQRLRLPAGGVHTVVRGDTVYDLADRYGVDAAAIVRINELRPPYHLTVGQRLVLPSRPAGTPEIRTVAAGPDIPRPGVKPPPPGAGSPEVAPETTRTARRRPMPLPQTGPPPPRSASGFLWPLRGRIVSRYGTAGHGLQNDGINIRARRGTPIRAVENGVVAYSGNELRGFGNLLLIKHEGGWISAYAHNDELLVRTGERVRRGQVISRVGSTGNVDSPQLHFELRRGNRAVDPERYLGRRSASLAGR